MTVSPSLQAIVADVVREVVAERSHGPARAPAAPAPAPRPPAELTPGAQHVVTRSGKVRTESVRIGSDRELEQFTRRLLEMFENPKHRADLRNGWLRFSLVGAPPVTTSLAGPAAGSTSGPVSTRRVPKGAVTERDITAAAEAGQGLLLAKGAVLTPLARERARALGVPVEKEK